MHYRIVLLFLLLLLPSLFVRAQVPDRQVTVATEQSSTDASGVTFTVAPLSLVGSYRRIRAGLIWHRPRWDYLVDLEYAPGFRGLNLWTETRHHFLYGIRPEVRYAFHRNGNIRHYAGVEVPVNYLEAVIDNGKFYNTAGEYIAFDRGVRHRERVAMLLKYTLATSISRHVYFETYTGLGAARRRNYYRQLINAREGNDYLIGSFESDWGSSPPVGTDWVFDYALGFRLGYRL